ncbi:DUF3429 domain-containing protein [Rhodobacter sp. KR11]|uniref:DUF3429 domain-containing protein n=1 Tax=Rhodobacter sp. KR11 TaxID=2974588 RepID=UPI002222932A|nr:DUF3429 domain-containing protein [Rhodobacter sp. KR11]MCW1917237.1 DUF3429 domain-containing protein [Rhodobacter sp. KR11]
MIPRAALVLGLAGLIPFAWGAASAANPTLAGISVTVFGPELWGVWMILDYGIVILSFMSGVLWGFATRATARAWVWYGLSVLPALWVFLGLRGETDSRLLALAAGYLGLLGLDFAFWRAGLTPPWWMRLRLILTAGVLVSLGFGLYL